MAQECSRIGAIFELSLDPTIPIEQVSNEQLYRFAEHMKYINTVYGTPVLLRFMHEMNGNWLVFGQKPTEFIQAFVTLSSYVHSLTNLVMFY
jgi:beta-mannanase